MAAIYLRLHQQPQRSHHHSRQHHGQSGQHRRAHAAPGKYSHRQLAAPLPRHGPRGRHPDAAPSGLPVRHHASHGLSAPTSLLAARRHPLSRPADGRPQLCLRPLLRPHPGGSAPGAGSQFAFRLLLRLRAHPPEDHPPFPGAFQFRRSRSCQFLSLLRPCGEHAVHHRLLEK